jgi:hypothetical protein
MNWDNFFILLFFGIPALLVLYGMFDWLKDIRELYAIKKRNTTEKEIREKGIKMNAVVKEIIQTGIFINENPEVELTVTKTNNSVEITFRTIVTLVMIPRLQPGCTVKIVVDPANSLRATLAKQE